ncbi:MAG: aminoglycoside phosphotransferase family protein [Alphaproteobacteria bacterium]|nr:aminoglycoside phosphotransferase family protein [Alphaproteobacteria bacterium]
MTQALRTMGLVDQAQESRFEPLAGGVSSDIWRVDTPRGPICVKRARPRLAVAADWCVPVARNAVEAAWFRTAGTILPDAVPQILAEDRDADIFAMSYLDPASHPTWKSGLLDGSTSAGVAAAVGRRLASLHAATANRPDLAEAFANDDLFAALRIDPYLIAAAKAHPDIAERLQELAGITLSTQRALIHGDVSPKNILVGEAGPVFLDAECAVYGDPAFDLAFCLTHLMLKPLAQPQAMALHLASYRSLVDAYLDGVTWEPVGDLAARAAALLPALMLARVDGKSPVDYLATGQQAEVRNFARAWLFDPAKELDTIAAAWRTRIMTKETV